MHNVTAHTQGVELGVSDFTTRRPWFETEMTIGFRPRRGRNATLNLIFFFEKRVVRVIKINFFLFELGHPNMIKPLIDVDVPHVRFLQNQSCQ